MRLAARATLLWGLWGAGGCVLQLDPPLPPLSGPVDTTAQDIAAYDELSARLQTNRGQFLSKQFSYQEAYGDKLYYLDFPGFDPRLHRYDTVAAAGLDYSFSIGSGDAWNYRVSDALVVTAHNNGGQVEYDAYAADAPNQLVGLSNFIAPSGAKWWAYAVSGEDVYVVTYEAADQTTTLRKWTPRLGGMPQPLFTLEAATGQATLGEFVDFGVDGDTLVFIEGGRIWQGSLLQMRATWLHNMTQVTGGEVHFDPDGVAFTTASGWYFFQSATMTLIDLAARIQGNPYRLNDTFKTSHYYDPDASGFTRWNNYMIYIGGAGVYAYALDRDTVTPVLLEPRNADVRTVYRSPQATRSGQLFVTGLESTDGSVGADGPVFRVDLTRVLN
jgi:hypothetical protein